MRARRVFLVAAAVWDLAVGVVAIRLPEGRAPRSTASGVVVLVFAALFAVLAVRPHRALLIGSAVAKAVGGTTGVVGLARGRRDPVTLMAVADAVWLPGFVLALRGSGRSRPRAAPARGFSARRARARRPHPPRS